MRTFAISWISILKAPEGVALISKDRNIEKIFFSHGLQISN